MEDDRPEITDLIVDHEPGTLRRLEVHKADVLARLDAHGMTRALRIVQKFPEAGGVLDARFVDGVFVRSHMELQRLSEEFLQGDRMLRLLRPMLAAMRDAGELAPHVVDVGCGSGYVLRWLAASRAFGEHVALTGCDYNETLVRLARRLAREERLGVDFHHEDAFRLARPATIYLSSGVLHHFRGASLAAFFARQREVARGFVHCDIKPTYLAGVGSWIFHTARMRESVARHDGVLSALRSYPATRLLAAAREGATGWKIGVFDGRVEMLPVLRVMQALVGVREDVADAFIAELGPLAERITWS